MGSFYFRFGSQNWNFSNFCHASSMSVEIFIRFSTVYLPTFNFVQLKNENFITKEIF